MGKVLTYAPAYFQDFIGMRINRRRRLTVLKVLVNKFHYLVSCLKHTAEPPVNRPPFSKPLD